MDTLKYEQIEKLQEHQPIPKGAQTLSIAAAFVAFAVFAGTPAVFREVGLGSVLYWLALVIAIVSRARDIARWLKSYWRRNVRGYRLACWIGSDSSGRRELRHVVIAPGNALKSEGVSAVTLVLPLGGWFRRPTIVAPEKEGYHRLWGSVRLRLRYPLSSLDNVGGCSIRITDRYGDRVTITVQRALEHLEQFGVNTFARALDGWRNAFDLAFERSMKFGREREELEHCLLPLVNPSGRVPTDRRFVEYVYEQVRRLIAERDAARGEVDRYQNGFLPAAVKDRDAARQERDVAVHFVNDLDIALQESHRLRTAIEGLRLRLRILEWLKAHDPRWTEEGPESLAPILATVRAELADKERRDRRRHGKGATATT